MDATRETSNCLDPTTVGYALLFSIPVGVGVSGATMRMTGGGALDPLVALPGAVTATAVFLFVLVAARGDPTNA